MMSRISAPLRQIHSQPASQHWYVLFVLACLEVEAKQKECKCCQQTDFQRKMLFAIGDHLRRNGCDLGWHAIFSESDKHVPEVILHTIDSTLDQCVEAGWLMPFSPADRRFCYSLTNSAKSLLDVLPNAGIAYKQCGGNARLLNSSMRKVIMDEVRKWVQHGMSELHRHLTQELPVRALSSETPVAHYKVGGRFCNVAEGARWKRP